MLIFASEIVRSGTARLLSAYLLANRRPRPCTPRHVSSEQLTRNTPHLLVDVFCLEEIVIRSEQLRWESCRKRLHHGPRAQEAARPRGTPCRRADPQRRHQLRGNVEEPSDI